MQYSVNTLFRKNDFFHFQFYKMAITEFTYWAASIKKGTITPGCHNDAWYCNMFSDLNSSNDIVIFRVPDNVDRSKVLKAVDNIIKSKSVK